MDIRILKQFKPIISTFDLEIIMRANPEIDDVIKCNYKDLLEVRVVEVHNLFKADKKTIKFRHESNFVISKFEGKIKESSLFEVTFDDLPFFECGINYAGRLRVNGTLLYIRVIGEGTYDPASREPYVTKQEHAIITGIYCAAMYALKRDGAHLVKKIFKVFKLNKVCQNRRYLVNYMRYQIEETIIKKKPTKDYGLYLKEDAKFLKNHLLKKEYEDLIMYLNLFDLGLKTEMFPSEKYMAGLLKNRGDIVSNWDLFKFVESRKREIYLLPTVSLVRKIARIDESKHLYDMRVLGKDLDRLEEEYSQRVKETLGNSDGGMGKLTEPYAHCCLIE